MSSDLASRLTDPAMLVALFVAIAVFATLYTIAVPFFERGDLNKRMRAVSTERDQIRARERARMNADAGAGKASLRAQNNRSVRQIVERFNLREALVDENTMNKLRAAGYRSENALNTFLVARFLLPFLFLAAGAFYVFGLGHLIEKPLPIRLLAVIGTAYLGFYADDFAPEGGQLRAAWAEQRRERILKPSQIKVDVSKLSITQTAPGQAEAKFLQAYQSDNYSDRVNKIIELKLVGGSWKITREYTQ